MSKTKPALATDSAAEIDTGIASTNGEGDSSVKTTIDRGVAVLTGVVGSESERAAIEAAAERLPDVRAIASDLVLRNTRESADADLARAALQAFKSNILIPDSSVKVIVRDGRIVLKGSVSFHLQKMLVEATVKKLYGVKSITNLVTVEPSALATQSAPGSNGLAEGEASTNNTEAWIDTGSAEAG